MAPTSEIWTEAQLASIDKMLNPRSVAVVGGDAANAVRGPLPQCHVEGQGAGEHLPGEPPLR